MKVLVSKRNHVYLRDNMVFKEHKNPEAARLEAEFLETLKHKGVAVPTVLKVEKNVLCLEYIKGEPLPDFLLDQNAIARCGEVAEAIAKWFESFYSAVNHKETSEIRGDVNGRNFIITDSNIVGVDFEEHIFGRRETDLGRLLSYVSFYSYEDTTAQKKLEEMLIRSLARRFSLSEDILLEEKANELKVIEKLRNIGYTKKHRTY